MKIDILNLDKDILTHYTQIEKLEEKKKFTESPKSFFNSGKIGQWKNILSEAQIKKIEDFCKLEMKEQNYL
mgnify:CR=1 FL=1